MNTRQIRKTIRQKRRALSATQQRQHQHAAIKLLLQSGLLTRYQRFAIYLDNDGELATDEIIKLLLKMKKQVHLPVLFPFSKNRLWFVPYKKNSRLTNNRFNIAEPKPLKRQTTLASLSIIFMPLVAFDDEGNRIGMGGGFYDRTLSHGKKQVKTLSPLLVGLAHELQKLDVIHKQSWDIPLDAIITEKKIRIFTKAFF